MFPEAIRPDLEKYVQEWKAAEEAIKITEYFENELNVASVVELRYAGRRFIEVVGFCLSDTLSLNPGSNEHLKKFFLRPRRTAFEQEMMQSMSSFLSLRIFC